MLTAVIVNGMPDPQFAESTALAFCEALLAEGHRLAAVVFYHDASQILDPASVDDPDNARRRWCQLSAKHRFPLLVCAAAAARRGIHAQPVDAVTVGCFLPVGLATILDAVDRSDKTVTLSS